MTERVASVVAWFAFVAVVLVVVAAIVDPGFFIVQGTP